MPATLAWTLLMIHLVRHRWMIVPAFLGLLDSSLSFAQSIPSNSSPLPAGPPSNACGNLAPTQGQIRKMNRRGFQVFRRSPEDRRDHPIRLNPELLDFLFEARDFLSPTEVAQLPSWAAVFDSTGKLAGVLRNPDARDPMPLGYVLSIPNPESTGSAFGGTPNGEFSFQVIRTPRLVQKRFRFNDPWSDFAWRHILKIDWTFQERIAQLVNQSLLSAPPNDCKKLGFALRQSEEGGLLSFYDRMGSQPLVSLTIVGDRAYNGADLGNFMWGMAMRKLGFPYWTSAWGAEVNGFFNSIGQNNDKAWGIVLAGDSDPDQAAIRNGYFYPRP
jgi:hypothetical protein